MRNIFVINPVAGKMDPVRLLTPPIRAAQKLRPGQTAEIYITTGPGDAERFVRETCGAGGGPVRFFSCGGDGTLSEVVNGLAGSARAQFGLIPCGSGNDFAKMFPGRDFFDIAAQLDGQPAPVDLLRVNSRICVNEVNMGLDADAADYMTRFKRLPLVSGKLSYNLGLVCSVCQPLGHQLRVTADGLPPLEDQYLLAVAANGQYYGGHYRCAPRASLTDGLLDLCLVRKISRLQFPLLLESYREGRHVDDPRMTGIVTYRQCRRVLVEAARPVSLCVDGEISRAGTIALEALPGAAAFSLPAARSGGFSQGVAKAQRGTHFGD